MSMNDGLFMMKKDHYILPKLNDETMYLLRHAPKLCWPRRLTPNWIGGWLWGKQRGGGCPYPPKDLPNGLSFINDGARYFVGDASRATAEAMLSQAAPGVFIVRPSSVSNCLVVSLVVGDYDVSKLPLQRPMWGEQLEVRHLLIRQDPFRQAWVLQDDSNPQKDPVFKYIHRPLDARYWQWDYMLDATVTDPKCYDTIRLYRSCLHVVLSLIQHKSIPYLILLRIAAFLCHDEDYGDAVPLDADDVCGPSTLVLAEKLNAFFFAICALEVRRLVFYCSLLQLKNESADERRDVMMKVRTLPIKRLMFTSTTTTTTTTTMTTSTTTIANNATATTASVGVGSSAVNNKFQSTLYEPPAAKTPYISLAFVDDGDDDTSSVRSGGSTSLHSQHSQHQMPQLQIQQHPQQQQYESLPLPPMPIYDEICLSPLPLPQPTTSPPSLPLPLPSKSSSSSSITTSNATTISPRSLRRQRSHRHKKKESREKKSGSGRKHKKDKNAPLLRSSGSIDNSSSVMLEEELKRHGSTSSLTRRSRSSSQTSTSTSLSRDRSNRGGRKKKEKEKEKKDEE